MKAAEFNTKLQSILKGADSRADKARSLFALGCDRTDVVELTGMTYSQAHGIFKACSNGERANKGVALRTGTRTIHLKNGRTMQLHLSPTQTRYITQGGHEVVRIDHDSGPTCQACGDSVTFSLDWLGFVHTYSQAEPTHIEDRYENGRVVVATRRVDIVAHPRARRGAPIKAHQAARSA
jgi:hypothetical protein